MKEILIIRHVANEGPGYLADYLDQRSIPYRVLAIDRGERLPESLDQLSGMVFMGGPMSVNDDLPWIPQALHLIHKALVADIPVLGHCLGGQLIARALGASVGPNPVPEYGWLPVQVADGGVAGQWFGPSVKEFVAFHWHGETFELPQGAARILSSKHCVNQAFIIGNALALQCHIEMTPELVKDWVSHADNETLIPSPTVQGRGDILKDLETRIESMQKIADTVYDQWMEGFPV